MIMHVLVCIGKGLIRHRSTQIKFLIIFFLVSQQEKEAVKKQLDQARNELYKTTDVTTSAEKLLREKDQQIAELMEEGKFS